MKKVHLKRLASNRVKKGYPVLTDLDIYNQGDAKEGDLIRLIDPKKKFVGIGYLGEENSNIGWVLSTKDREINKGFILEKLSEAKKYRRVFFENEDTTAFRVFNGHGDGIGGMTIDYYNGFYVVSWYNKGIYQHRELILETFKDIFVHAKGVYEKSNFPDSEVKNQHLFGKEAPEPLIIKENGINYATYLNDSWMTGIFFDQREVRYDIMTQYGVGKNVLNLFSYTGAFSVAATMGGALKTVNIDVAKRSKELTTEQFEVNQLDVIDHEIRVIDVESYLDYAQKHDLKFGLVVIDPPTFARTDKGTWSVEEDYSRIISQCLNILENDGTLIVSTNAWKLSADDFYDIVEKGFNLAHVDGVLIDNYTLPQDYRISETYPESSYLKVFALQKD